MTNEQAKEETRSAPAMHTGVDIRQLATTTTLTRPDNNSIVDNANDDNNDEDEEDDAPTNKSSAETTISSKDDIALLSKLNGVDNPATAPDNDEDFFDNDGTKQQNQMDNNRRGSRLRFGRRRSDSEASDGMASRNSGTTRTTTVTRKSSHLIGMDGIFNRLNRRSEVWETASMISDLEDEDDERHYQGGMSCSCVVGCLWYGMKSSGRWLRATLKTAFTTPSILIPCLVMFAGMVICGMLIVYGFENAETTNRKQTATAVAEQTDLFFVRVLENAFVPLFTMAQFVHELPEFHLLDIKVGERCDPITDVYNCTMMESITRNSSSSAGLRAPVMTGKETTHRNLTDLFNTEYGQMIDKKFNSIAAGIKANSRLGKSLVSIQLAPKGVVSLIHPMVNCEDFDNGYCMNNTGAWGHDLLNDPGRKGIARATVPAEGVVTAGPLKLIQGRDTFIARLPINMVDAEGEEEMERHSMVVDGVDYPCWGFAVVLLDWERLKEDSNIYTEFDAEQMQFKLTRTDIKDGKEEVKMIAESANSDLIVNDNITLALDTGDNGWVIAVGYDDGFDPEYKKWAYPVVFCVALAFTILMMLVLVSKKEHERLLLNLMPRRAIRKLRKGETVVDRYTMATIFFSDIVGYTNMSADMTPIEVMKMLNDFYSVLDALAEKHGIFKVETIGDAYIAVAGCPKKCPGPEAAEKMALFALDALRAVQEFRTEDGAKIAIRAGLASGPVVAGVVGSSLPKYTLFGDTVNFAARMEQTGKTMRLQISPVTYRMLLDAPNHDFKCEARRDDDGELGVEVKGKGRQQTYWVVSASKLDKRRETVHIRQCSSLPTTEYDKDKEAEQQV